MMFAHRIEAGHEDDQIRRSILLNTMLGLSPSDRLRPPPGYNFITPFGWFQVNALSYKNIIIRLSL